MKYQNFFRRVSILKRYKPLQLPYPGPHQRFLSTPVSNNEIPSFHRVLRLTATPRRLLPSCPLSRGMAASVSACGAASPYTRGCVRQLMLLLCASLLSLASCSASLSLPSFKPMKLRKDPEELHVKAGNMVFKSTRVDVQRLRGGGAAQGALPKYPSNRALKQDEVTI